MPVVHPGATLTPHFRDFLPGWVARQGWYLGTGLPSLRPVGFYRLEDSAGEVGIETHLVSDGSDVYQIPMTYRGAPLGQSGEASLVATAEHSVLGTRWIYDGPADPVWAAEVLRLVGGNGSAERSSRSGVGPVEAWGRRLAAGDLSAETAVIEVRRVLTEGGLPEGPIVGLVMGSWQPDGPDGPALTGCLAVVRPAAACGP